MGSLTKRQCLEKLPYSPLGLHNESGNPPGVECWGTAVLTSVRTPQLIPPGGLTVPEAALPLYRPWLWPALAGHDSLSKVVAAKCGHDSGAEP